MAYSLGKVTYVFVFPLYLCSSRSLCFRCIPALVLYIRLYLGYFSFKLNSCTTSFMKHFVIIFLSLKIDMTTLIKNKTDLLYCAHSTHSLWKLCVLVFFFFSLMAMEERLGIQTLLSFLSLYVLWLNSFICVVGTVNSSLKYLFILALLFYAQADKTLNTVNLQLYLGS